MANSVILDLKIMNVTVCKKIKKLRQKGINITNFIEYAILHTPTTPFLHAKL